MNLMLVITTLLFFSPTLGLRRSQYGGNSHPTLPSWLRLVALQPQTDARRTSGPVGQEGSSASTTSSTSIMETWSLTTAGTSDTGLNELWDPDLVLTMTSDTDLAVRRVTRGTPNRIKSRRPQSAIGVTENFYNRGSVYYVDYKGVVYYADQKSKLDYRITGNVMSEIKPVVTDTFTFYSTKGKQVYFYNTDDYLLVGNANHDFFLYGDTGNPDQLIEIQSGLCNIKTYTRSNGSGQQNVHIKQGKLDDRSCDKIKSKLITIQDDLVHDKQNTDGFKDNKEILRNLMRKFSEGISKNIVGQNYDLKYEMKEENGEWTETIEISGKPSSATRSIHDIFSPEVVEKDRFIHYTEDELLIGEVDQNFLLYGNINNPDQLIEIENGVCTIKTYSRQGEDVIIEDLVLDKEKCDSIKKQLKVIKDSLARDEKVQKQNNLIEERNKLNSLLEAFSKGFDQEFKSKNYVVVYSMGKTNGKWTESLEVRGNQESATKHIQDSFNSECQGDTFFKLNDDELFVGGTKENFLLYGNSDNPDQLIEIRDGKCTIKTYTSNGEGASETTKGFDAEYLDEGRYAKISDLIENVEERLLNNKENKDDFKEKQNQLNQLMIKFTKGIVNSITGSNYNVELTTLEKADKCTVTMKISGSAAPTSLVKDTYVTECNQERLIQNTPDALLISIAEQNLLLYSHLNRPDQLIEIRDDICKIKTYTSDEQTKFIVEQLNEIRYGKIKGLMETVKNGIINQKDFQDSQIKLDRLVKTFTKGLFERFPGQNYNVEYKKIEKDQTCTETIDVTGKEDKATKLILGTFNPDCEGDRFIHYDQEVLFVGGTEQNYLLCGNLENPDQLIEVKNKKCKIITYPSNGVEDENLDEGRYAKISGLLKNVEDHLVKNQDSADDFNEKQKQLNLWVTKFTKGLTETGQSSNFIVDFNTKEKSFGECTVSYKIHGLPTAPTNYADGTFTKKC